MGPPNHIHIRRTRTVTDIVTPTDAAPARSDRSRWIALLVLCTGMLMIVLDATIVNVALPSIQNDLGFSQANLTWVINAYLIAFGGLLLLAGRLGDLIGRRLIFIIGLAIFTGASLACAVAQSQGMLIAARFVQGAGGAMTSAVILGMIVTMFREAREQAKAIGVYSFVASAGGAIGLLMGGVLTQTVNWHFIFFVNLPVGVATLALATRLVPRDSGAGFGQGADVPGAVMGVGALMLGVFSIVEAAAGLLAIVTGAAAVALLVAFLIHESRTANPLLPLRMFRSRTMSGANLVQALSVAGMFGMFFLGALYLQRVLHYDALQVGIAFLPTTVVMGGLSLGLSERLSTRFGPRALLLPGLGLIAVGLALLARAPMDGSFVRDVLPSMVLLGTGAGIGFPSLMGLAMAGVEPADAGLASGLVSTTAQVGGAIGLAVLVTVSAGQTQGLLASGQSEAAALLGGYHLAFIAATVLVLAALVIASLLLRPAKVAATVEFGGESERMERNAA
jgi:EmrB/QacA subfamily drug resistance transporter